MCLYGLSEAASARSGERAYRVRVLVLNCGSSSLKFRVVDIRDETSTTMISGMVDRIGGEARLRPAHGSLSDSELQQDIRNHDQAVRWALDRCKRCDVVAVGHRVVHGGANFQQPVRIDATVTAEIEQLSEPAPLHNPACLFGINAARMVLGHEMPMVAVFETAFFCTMPEYPPPTRFHRTWRRSIASGAMGSTGSPMPRSCMAMRRRRDDRWTPFAPSRCISGTGAPPRRSREADRWIPPWGLPRWKAW
ncbi:putative Acetate kinase [Nitrospira defluvii]|uniref:Acetate kinase n=1 Tax=Nitrospira defluvii TaxID=330214 RepID=A0ABM8R8Y4_9BACT|nr:putative Acetate kinase [Nitrospira defluvii]